jgi:hypothetical protein
MRYHQSNAELNLLHKNELKIMVTNQVTKSENSFMLTLLAESCNSVCHDSTPFCTHTSDLQSHCHTASMKSNYVLQTL